MTARIYDRAIPRFDLHGISFLPAPAHFLHERRVRYLDRFISRYSLLTSDEDDKMTLPVLFLRMLVFHGDVYFLICIRFFVSF